MDKTYLKGIIEEILYIWGEAIDVKELAKIIDFASRSQIKESLEEMKKSRDEKKSGLIIRKFDGKYQFSTRSEHEKYISKIVKKSAKKLSNSSLETLSIIAYKQPITRAEIDKIRGLNSQSTIDSLIERNLIRENGRLDKIGKPIIYITTEEFLKYFNLESLDDLPKIKLENNNNEDK